MATYLTLPSVAARIARRDILAPGGADIRVHRTTPAPAGPMATVSQNALNWMTSPFLALTGNSPLYWVPWPRALYAEPLLISSTVAENAFPMVFLLNGSMTVISLRK